MPPPWKGDGDSHGGMGLEVSPPRQRNWGAHGGREMEVPPPRQGDWGAHGGMGLGVPPPWQGAGAGAHLVSTVKQLAVPTRPPSRPGPWARTRVGSQPSATATRKGLSGTATSLYVTSTWCTPAGGKRHPRGQRGAGRALGGYGGGPSLGGAGGSPRLQRFFGVPYWRTWGALNRGFGGPWLGFWGGGPLLGVFLGVPHWRSWGLH